MVRVASFIHIMLLVEFRSPLVAAHFHSLQLLQLPFVHVERPTEGDMGANRSVIRSAIVTDKDSYRAACPDRVLGLAVEAKLE